MGALFVGVLTETQSLVVGGAVGGLVLDLRAHRRLTGSLPKQVDVIRGELHARLLLSQLLVVAFVLGTDRLGSFEERVVVASVVVHQALRMLFSALQIIDARLRLGRAYTRGLRGVGPGWPARPALLSDGGLVVIGLAAGALPASLGWALVSGSWGWVGPAAAVGAGTALAVVLAVAPSVVRLARHPHGEAQVHRVHDAVLRHGPEVVLYSTGGANDIHWLTPWLDVLEQLDRPALIMLRARGTVELVPPTTTPVVCLPETGDVHAFVMPTARVALFVANGADNLRLLRHPTLRSAFVGHGDSDKSSSASRASRMYDEVWVAGPAARQRYLDADVGLPPERIRVVGRPQVRRVERVTGGPMPWPCTVLYAPTWEGIGLDPYESSVAVAGPAVVDALLALPGIRVIFRPHPATGRHDAAAARAVRDITAHLEQAGPQHETIVGSGVDLYAIFNRSDALVADVSGVVTDFIASGKPYFVVNGRGLADDEYRRRNPSTSAAYLVGPGGEGLETGLRDAAGPDSLRAARLELREQLLGPFTEDALAPFRAAVDALAASRPSVAVDSPDAPPPAPASSTVRSR